jgi:hypothetical protein
MREKTAMNKSGIGNKVKFLGVFVLISGATAKSNANDERCYFTDNDCENYKEVQIYEDWSEWKRGGYNRDAWCSDLRRRFESIKKQTVEWTVIATDESSEERPIRRYYYRYFCRAQARW